MHNKVQFTLIENSIDFALIQLLNQYNDVTVVGKTGKSKYVFSFNLPTIESKNSFESRVVSKLSSMDKGIIFMLKDTAKLIYAGNSCKDTGSSYIYYFYFEEL